MTNDEGQMTMVRVNGSNTKGARLGFSVIALFLRY
jgi:hypothetical protein